MALLADCRDRAADLSWAVVHEVPAGDAKVLEQNYERGKVAGLEDLLELEKELAEFKESRKS